MCIDFPKPLLITHGLIIKGVINLITHLILFKRCISLLCLCVLVHLRLPVLPDIHHVGHVLLVACEPHPGQYAGRLLHLFNLIMGHHYGL